MPRRRGVSPPSAVLISYEKPARLRASAGGMIAPRPRASLQSCPPKLSPLPARRCRAMPQSAQRAEKRTARLPNPAPGARLRHPVPGARVHLPLPDRPARLRALHHRHDRRRALRRAEEPEDVLLELPQRGRLPREGDQHHPSTTSSRPRAALHPHHGQVVRARRHLHQRGGEHRKKGWKPQPPVRAAIAHAAETACPPEPAARRQAAPYLFERRAS